MSVFLRQHYVVLPASRVGSTIVTVVRITRWYSTSQTRYISKTIGAPVYGLRFSARYPSFSVLMLVLYVLHGSTKSMGFSCVEYGGDSTSDKIEQQASDGGRPRSRRMFCFTHRRLVLWLHNEGETYLSNNGDLCPSVSFHPRNQYAEIALKLTGTTMIFCGERVSHG